VPPGLGPLTEYPARLPREQSHASAGRVPPPNAPTKHATNTATEAGGIDGHERTRAHFLHRRPRRGFSNSSSWWSAPHGGDDEGVGAGPLPIVIAVSVATSAGPAYFMWPRSFLLLFRRRGARLMEQARPQMPGRSILTSRPGPCRIHGVGARPSRWGILRVRDCSGVQRVTSASAVSKRMAGTRRGDGPVVGWWAPGPRAGRGVLGLQDIELSSRCSVCWAGGRGR